MKIVSTKSKHLPILLLILVLVVVTVIGYFVYTFYVQSPEGSVLDEAGNRAVPITINNATPTPESLRVEPTVDQVTGSIVNKLGGYKLVFPGTMYITGSPETLSPAVPVGSRTTFISFNYDVSYTSSIQINYGIPTLIKSETIDCPIDVAAPLYSLGGVKLTSYCINPEFENYAIGNLINPHRKIEYSIYIRGTQAEKDKYLEILKNGLTWQ